MHSLGDGGECIPFTDHLARARPAESGQEVRRRAAGDAHGPCTQREACVFLGNAGNYGNGVNQLLCHETLQIVSGIVDLVVAVGFVRFARKLVDP